MGIKPEQELIVLHDIFGDEKQKSYPGEKVGTAPPRKPNPKDQESKRHHQNGIQQRPNKTQQVLCG